MLLMLKVAIFNVQVSRRKAFSHVDLEFDFFTAGDFLQPRVDLQAEFPAHEVGMAILAPLRELDDVAFLRFASVYKQYESADDFEIEIESLRRHRAEQLADLLDGESQDLTSAPSG